MAAHVATYASAKKEKEPVAGERALSIELNVSHVMKRVRIEK